MIYCPKGLYYLRTVLIVKMAKYKITLNNGECIGAASCQGVAPENYKVVDGKAKITKTGIGEDELAKNLQAARSCPVRALKITDTETGKEVPF